MAKAANVASSSTVRSCLRFNGGATGSIEGNGVGTGRKM